MGNSQRRTPNGRCQLGTRDDTAPNFPRRPTVKVDSLWYDVKSDRSATMTVSLKRCRNCGNVKIVSNPCSFDHLAAIMEWRASVEQQSA